MGIVSLQFVGLATFRKIIDLLFAPWPVFAGLRQSLWPLHGRNVVSIKISINSACWFLCVVLTFILLWQPARAAVEECAHTFDRSEMSLFSFRRLRCTDKGWSIARRQGNAEAQCAALDPSDRMIVVLDSNGTSDVMLRNLGDPTWLTTADQFGKVKVEVDGLRLFSGLTQVNVSSSPPLRYGFLWPLPKDNIGLLKSGHALSVTIGKGHWNISLAGSEAAIAATQSCASEPPSE